MYGTLISSDLYKIKILQTLIKLKKNTNSSMTIYYIFVVAVCYLGYGSPAKLLSSAIKKVITAPTELDCKNECIRYRETTPFKCHSFSYG